MTRIRSITILFAVLTVTGLTAGYQAVAHMEGTRERQGHGTHHMSSAKGEDAVASVMTEPEHIIAGSPATITFSIKDREGQPIKNLTVHHDRLIHVVIASKDFSVFAHVHPQDFGPITSEMKRTARYPVRFAFPKAGPYIIGIDFAVEGQPVSKHFLVNVSGVPEMGQPKADLKGDKRFGDLDVEFSSEPKHITAGEKVTLTYYFRRNGEKVTDLEPYLSAPMHLAIISDSLTHFIHAHGEIPGMSPTGHHEHGKHMAVPELFGPEIDVPVVFPGKGLYQIFGQVGYKGKVILTSFMVEVK